VKLVEKVISFAKTRARKARVSVSFSPLIWWVKVFNLKSEVYVIKSGCKKM
jgi:hypothetical protein